MINRRSALRWWNEYLQHTRRTCRCDCRWKLLVWLGAPKGSQKQTDPRVKVTEKSAIPWNYFRFTQWCLVVPGAPPNRGEAVEKLLVVV